MIDHNAKTAMNQADYQAQYEEVVQRYEEAKSQLDETVKQIRDRQSRRQRIDDYLKLLVAQPGPPAGFGPALLHATVETITVHSDGQLTFTMKDGEGIEMQMEV